MSMLLPMFDPTAHMEDVRDTALFMGLTIEK